MPSAIRRTRGGSVSRRDPINNRPPKTSAIRIVSAEAAGSTLTVTFNQAVMLTKGLVPQYITDVAGADPVSVVVSGPSTIVITYDASIAAATQVTIDYEEPAIRNSIGGYVADSTFPVGS